MNRWMILGVLFLARVSMAFQFQAVAALSPEISARLDLNLSQIGLLIGLYLAPGVIVAIPGGALAMRVGAKRIVVLGLSAMLAGALLASLLPYWEMVLTGRVISGIGGVVLNVVMTKMVIDWFAGREASTAMAIYINSWPVGIAVALLTLPLAAALGGLPLAQWIEIGVIGGALALFAGLYRAPPSAATSPSASPDIPAAGTQDRMPMVPLILAALVWAFYNAALAMVFGFAPTFLSERGTDLAAAGSLTGTFMLLLAVSLPMGGILADRSGRRDLVIATSLVSFPVLILLIAAGAASGPGLLTLLLVAGFLFGLAGGPIMTLTAPILPAPLRSLGMGILWAVYYAVMMVAPIVAGGLADLSGTAGTALQVGAALSVLSLVSLIAFRAGRARA